MTTPIELDETQYEVVRGFAASLPKSAWGNLSKKAFHAMLDAWGIKFSSDQTDLVRAIAIQISEEA